MIIARTNANQLGNMTQIPVAYRANSRTQYFDVFAYQIGDLEGLVWIDDDFALFFVGAGNEKHVVEGGRVVQNGVVFERVEHISRPKF